MAERPDLCDLTAADIAPLESLFDPLTPDTWRAFARSQYITLRTLFADQQPAADLAQLALQLTKGIAIDEGGSQPYIPVGAQMMQSARVRRIIDLCNAGKGYADVAREVGNITEARVRNIERAWRQEQRALRQGKLDLE
ncbi:MAG: Mor transcription activator family protein [Rhodoferax sp.]|nr:Mor transcription activator family protein [Rhodoferax sp.]